MKFRKTTKARLCRIKKKMKSVSVSNVTEETINPKEVAAKKPAHKALLSSHTRNPKYMTRIQFITLKSDWIKRANFKSSEKEKMVARKIGYKGVRSISASNGGVVARENTPRVRRFLAMCK